MAVAGLVVGDLPAAEHTAPQLVPVVARLLVVGFLIGDLVAGLLAVGLLTAALVAAAADLAVVEMVLGPAAVD